jgi:iron complex transport system substrate-binding protein
MELKTTRKKRNNYLYFISILAIFTMLTLAVAPVSCSEQQSKDSRTIVDMVGNTVTIPTQVNKIVALYGACSVPVMLSALGVGDKLIGGLCFTTPMQTIVQPEYAKLETYKVQEYEGNIEELLKLKPDVVIGWYTLKNEQAMRDAGIALVMHKSSNFDDSMRSIELLGEITGTEEKAKELISYFNDTTEMIGNKVSNIPQNQRKKVMILSKSNPIKIYAADSAYGDMIRKAGGISVTDNMPGFFAEINMETLLNLDPDYIIVSPASPTAYNDVMNDSAWDTVRAKKEGHIILGPTGVFYWDKSPVEPNLFLLWMVSHFYPDMISSDQLKDEAKKFYSKFFKYDISDEEYNMILYSKNKIN